MQQKTAGETINLDRTTPKEKRCHLGIKSKENFTLPVNEMTRDRW